MDGFSSASMICEGFFGEFGGVGVLFFLRDLVGDYGGAFGDGGADGIFFE